MSLIVPVPHRHLLNQTACRPGPHRCDAIVRESATTSTHTKTRCSHKLEGRRTIRTPRPSRASPALRTRNPKRIAAAPPVTPDSPRWSVERRLAFIEERLFWLGEI